MTRMNGMKGYKAFDKDMKCRNMQYEVGKGYKMNEKPVICNTGFHFCKSIADCYNFYDMNEDTIICEIRALGEIVSDEDEIKFCTNHIKIVKKISNPRLKSNTSETNSGYCNSGNRNSGNRNSGNRNSGNRNSGDRNSGNRNSGNRNSGNRNSGDWNSGDCNSGDWNSGDCNSGDRNSGDWNSGVHSSGIFCTEKDPKIKIFDIDSNWTFTEWRNSRAFEVISTAPYTNNTFITESGMSDEDKENHPEFKTTGGYTKTIIVTNEDRQNWWDALSDEDKECILALPNFDAVKFQKCTGIDINKKGE